MKFNTSIFKSYDVRGIYPNTINEEIAEKIGMAFVNKFNVKIVAVGRDGRVSSPVLFESLTDGIQKAGADVVDLGITTTDMTYFASGYYPDIDAAIMITASHNPMEHNGMKFCLKNANALSGESGLYEVRDIIANNKLVKNSKKGNLFSRNIYRDYGDKLLKIIHYKEAFDKKVVVDAGNGVAGFVIEKMFEKSPFGIIPLYFEVDGRFPNHPANPIERKNNIDLVTAVLEEKADFGIAFDGDGDRAFFVDENGKMIPSTIISALISEYLLKRHKGSAVVHNLLCGNILDETILGNGGKAIETRVGHSIIKPIMRQNDAVFGAEHSAHYYFKDLYFADSGLLASLFVLKILSSYKKPLSKVLNKFQKYATAEENNFTVKNGKDIIEKIKQKYKSGKQSEVDGLSVKFPTWHFNVRMSGTEPLMRLNLEADTKDLMKQKLDEVSEIINQS